MHYFSNYTLFIFSLQTKSKLVLRGGRKSLISLSISRVVEAPHQGWVGLVEVDLVFPVQVCLHQPSWALHLAQAPLSPIIKVGFIVKFFCGILLSRLLSKKAFCKQFYHFFPPCLCHFCINIISGTLCSFSSVVHHVLSRYCMLNGFLQCDQETNVHVLHRHTRKERESKFS